MRFTLLALMLLTSPITSGGEVYTLFTWIPGWEQMRALDRSQANPTRRCLSFRIFRKSRRLKKLPRKPRSFWSMAKATFEPPS